MNTLPTIRALYEVPEFANFSDELIEVGTSVPEFIDGEIKKNGSRQTIRVIEPPKSLQTLASKGAKFAFCAGEPAIFFGNASHITEAYACASPPNKNSVPYEYRNDYTAPRPLNREERDYLEAYFMLNNIQR